MEMNAQGLASLGRGGDDQIGHLTTGEKVLPLPVAQDPSVQRVINESFAEHGLDAEQYTVGHANNSINPNTQYAEFGFFKKLGKAFRKVAQIVGTVVGFIYGGPQGAAIGSSIGGGVRRGKFDLKHAVTDAIGGYTLGRVATGMGMVGGTGAGQGIGGLKAAFQGAGQGGMWGWQATPSTAGGIGGFFQNVGANAASFLKAPTATAGPYSGVAANIPSIGEAYGSLGMLGKAGVMGIGALAAGKMGAFDQPELQGPPEGMGLSEEQKQYLTKGLTPATTMPGVGGVGGSSSGPMGQYQGGAGVGGLNNPNQALLDFLEEQKRKYLMQFPSFQTGQRQFGYNDGGPVKGLNPDSSSYYDPDWQPAPTTGQQINNFMGRAEDYVSGGMYPYTDTVNSGLDMLSNVQMGGNVVHPGLLSFLSGANNMANNAVRGTVGALIPGGRTPVRDRLERRRARQNTGQESFDENVEALVRSDERKDMNQGGPVPRQGYAKGGEVDTVPAMLTEDEHVLTVDAIRGLGGGDIEKGHQIAKQLNDSAEEQLQNKILERKYFMQFPEFNRGVA